MSLHKLNTGWILWHHNIENKEWDINSYNELWSIESIEDYWNMYNSWNKCLPKLNESMFFITRNYGEKKVLPMWEDPHNSNGGYWSFKISIEKIHKCWNNLLIGILGENITENTENIMGISISPKKHFCIIKIWVNNTDFNINDIKISDLNIKEAIFRSYQ